jgi:hypothetical protein
MVSFRNDVVVRRRVRRREPKSDIPLELVTCGGGVCLGGYESERIKTNVSSCSRRWLSAEGSLQREVSAVLTKFARDTYLKPVGCHPLTPCHLMDRMLSKMSVANQGRLRTFHHQSRIINKTMDHAQGLCNRCSSLFLGQSVESLEHGLHQEKPPALTRGNARIMF